MAIQTNQEMLSFLTHSLNNILGSAPETVRQTIRLLSRSGDYEKNTAQYKAINNISSLFTIFYIVDNLIQTFKQCATKPEIFQLSWHQDNQGEGHIDFVVAFALRQTLSRILFHSSVAKVKELLHDTEINIKKLRHSFIDEIIALELTPDNTEKVFAWIKQHFNIFRFDLEFAKEIHFAENGARFTFLFSILSELIYNALKYSDGLSPIKLVSGIEADLYYFTCTNSFNPDLRYRESGSRQGLEFIDKMMKMLENSSLSYHEQGDIFTVKLSFAKINFEEKT
jgi:hypothetical protein